MIPGVDPIFAPVDSQTTNAYPSGNVVAISRPGDPNFRAVGLLGNNFAGRANFYVSHGAPGVLEGGIPEAQVRTFLNGSNDPLIVLSCWAGAPLQGGSTIRRLVSAYANDPLLSPLRVYGCTGESFVDDVGQNLLCRGAWVDANQEAVPADERQRLNLRQFRCANPVHAPNAGFTEDCVPAD
jgi:hypothetical protein